MEHCTKLHAEYAEFNLTNETRDAEKSDDDTVTDSQTMNTDSQTHLEFVTKAPINYRHSNSSTY